MGMLNEMFGSNDGKIPPVTSTLLAEGTYKSDADTILSGYKTYQKKYVVKQLVVKLFIVLIATASSVMMILTNSSGSPMPFLCLAICLAAAWYFINEPLGNKKKLKASLDVLQGTEYEARIYSDKIVISTIPDENVENSSDLDSGIDNENSGEENSEPQNNEIPATILHLDSPILDFIDRDDMFIVCVKKAYVFIIPKSAFSDDEIAAVKDKMSLILGIRYKTA